MSEAHALLDAVGVAVYSVYEDGMIAFANAEAERLLGRSRDDMIGRHHHATMCHAGANGSVYDADACPICAAASVGGKEFGSHNKFQRADGSMIAIEYYVTPWKSPANARSGSVVTFRDATEQQDLHLQLLRAQKLESIGQLAAGIAHEINTPIQYVGDNTRFIERSFHQLKSLVDIASELASGDGTIPQETFQRLQRAAAEADWDFLRSEIPTAISQSLDGINRVAVIVRAMKEFSHASPTKTAIDLHHTIQNTITIARNEWKYVAKIATEFDPHLPMVSCLPGEVSQVILNLLVNAAHAIDAARRESSEKGIITISTARVGDDVEIRIRDTGTGIPAEVRDKIFDPFFTTKPVGKGTGQGLSLAYRIVVERHKGTIDFETEIGKGTTFIVRLPIDEPITPETDEAQREDAHSVC